MAKNKSKLTICCQLLIAMLVFFPWASAYTDDTLPPKPPFFVPFEAQKAGSVFTTELRVVEHRSYIFALALGAKKGWSKEDARRFMELAGRSGRDKDGKLIWPGISIPLKLKISVMNTSAEKIIYDREIYEEEAVSAGQRGIAKLIESIELKPGRYRINIQSLKDIPELVENPITFGIYRWPNTTPID